MALKFCRAGRRGSTEWIRPGGTPALRPLHLVMAAGAALTPGAIAQQLLQIPVSSERAAVERRLALQDLPYNVKLGPASLMLGAALDVQYNSNINLAESGRQSDAIFIPQITANAIWPVTIRNTLSLDLTVGYAKYVTYSEYDQLVIQPGSELSFNVYVGDFIFNFYDRFSYTANPVGQEGVVTQGAISGVAEYGGLRNNVGTGITWNLNELLPSLHYDHFIFNSSVAQFDYLNRGTDSLLARVSFNSREDVQWGPEIGGGSNRYSEPVLNDSWNYSAGAFAYWTVSPYININARGGYTQYLFQSGGVQDTPNSHGYYFTLAANQTVNEWMSHTLSAGTTLDLGIDANLTELYYVNYYASLALFRKVGFQPFLSYQHGHDIGGPGAQTYDLFGASLTLSYQFNSKLQASLRYSFSDKISNIPGYGYLQNLISLQASYRF